MDPGCFFAEYVAEYGHDAVYTL